MRSNLQYLANPVSCNPGLRARTVACCNLISGTLLMAFEQVNNPVRLLPPRLTAGIHVDKPQVSFPFPAGPHRQQSWCSWCEFRSQQSASLPYSPIPHRAVSLQGQLSRLRELNLKHCHRLSGESIAALSRLGSLQDLNVSKCWMVNDDSLCGLAHLRQLTALRMNGCDRVSDAGGHIKYHCHLLQYLQS